MARIFTIDFEFRGVNHAAIVSTWKEKMHTDSFQVLLYDEALFHLVPDGVVRFSTIEVNAEPKNSGLEELLYCLKKAVAGYLQRS